MARSANTPPYSNKDCHPEWSATESKGLLHKASFPFKNRAYSQEILLRQPADQDDSIVWGIGH